MILFLLVLSCVLLLSVEMLVVAVGAILIGVNVFWLCVLNNIMDMNTLLFWLMMIDLALVQLYWTAKYFYYHHFNQTIVMFNFDTNY